MLAHFKFAHGAAVTFARKLLISAGSVRTFLIACSAPSIFCGEMLPLTAAIGAPKMPMSAPMGSKKGSTTALSRVDPSAHAPAASPGLTGFTAPCWAPSGPATATTFTAPIPARTSPSRGGMLSSRPGARPQADSSKTSNPQPRRAALGRAWRARPGATRALALVTGQTSIAWNSRPDDLPTARTRLAYPCRNGSCWLESWIRRAHPIGNPQWLARCRYAARRH